MSAPLIQATELGLYCAAGDFFVDPWRPVPRAVITHAHSDHACRGHGRYLCSEEGRHVLRTRMGPEALIDSVPYGSSIDMNGVRVVLHPAGHILGSAQVSIEHRGEVWVVSGDYKTTPDSTCSTFEPVRCHGFITESTFGLPIYRWPGTEELASTINAWWRQNADEGRVSLLFGYALGKAQRLLNLLDPSIGPIFCHGAVEALNRAYRETGISLPPTEYAGASGTKARARWARGIVIAPPSAHGSPWARKFGPSSTAMASGWMAIRGTRRRRSIDRGFVVSDHADWGGLLSAIEATGATNVWVTHGYSAVLVRWLRDRGIDASTVRTSFAGEREDAEPEVVGKDETNSDENDPA